MQQNILIDKIEKEVEQLSPKEQLVILEKIAHNLRAIVSTKKNVDWNELYGSGKNVWKEDAQEFVTKLREERL